MKRCRNDIASTFASETENRIEMKNMLYCLLCNILLVALLLLTSCTNEKVDEKMSPDLKRRTGFYIGQSSCQLDFSRRESLSVDDRLSHRSQKEIIRWNTDGGFQ